MKLKKKGIFFTFIAVLMIAVLVFMLSPKSEISVKKNDLSETVRLESVNKLVNSLSGSLTKTIADATVYRALLSMTLYINKTGKYLDIENFDRYIADIAQNGTLNGTNIDSLTGQKIMENMTLKNWTSRIVTIANSTFRVNLSGYEINVTIYQVQPWKIEIFIIANYTVIAETATWQGPTAISSQLEIEGMTDPYYLRESNGMIPRTISRTDLQYYRWNISNLRSHVENATYIHWPFSQAPSFLMRFVNKTDNSTCCGIESVVNPNEITNPDREGSYVDYLFFSNRFTQANCTKVYNITNPGISEGLWDEFPFLKLDLENVARYNVTFADRIISC